MKRSGSNNEREEKDTGNIFPIYSSARSQQDMSAMVFALSQVIGNSSSSAGGDSSVDAVHVNPLTLIPQSTQQNQSQSSIQDQVTPATSSNNTFEQNYPNVHHYADLLLRSDNNIDLNFDVSPSTCYQYSSSGSSFDISQSSVELPVYDEQQQVSTNYNYQKDEEEDFMKYSGSHFGNSTSSGGPQHDESNWEEYKQEK
ncbi:hypothetical protein H5410_018630 [Solanum commersonii]|uniref:Uncharacterized protein n=1 Tax=Solanum commersonii TaxID=4109 RepID=A0A9J6A2G9_SOLCO|nr:hypothetical protein H5410_018630 [Solanum commersonii]